jgi:hypothetical protein
MSCFRESNHTRTVCWGPVWWSGSKPLDICACNSSGHTSADWWLSDRQHYWRELWPKGYYKGNLLQGLLALHNYLHVKYDISVCCMYLIGSLVILCVMCWKRMLITDMRVAIMLECQSLFVRRLRNPCLVILNSLMIGHCLECPHHSI